MAKSKHTNKTPVVVESIGDLADAGLQQKSVLGSNRPSMEYLGENVAEDMQKRADEFMAKNVVPWDMTEYYKKMSVQLLILKARIISLLRNHQSATTDLRECEEIMHTCLMLASKYKYTFPSWKRDLAVIDYHLVALAEINEMLGNKQWPTDIDGRPVKLNTYLESILWY